MPTERINELPQLPKSPILTINAGSSSIRFALFGIGHSAERLLHGKVDRIGLHGTNLTIVDRDGKSSTSDQVEIKDYLSAVSVLLRAIEDTFPLESLAAIGHRVVHGMEHSNPERVTPELLDELRRISPYDPDHLPSEIALIEAFGKRFPSVPQVACFDTAFHRTMPRVAKLLPIPRRYNAKGIQRYGFHGLSYSYLMQELRKLGDPAALEGRVILAHLGSGASLAAVLNGKCVDTSMGFTPTGGLMMGTRSGDLDPGLGRYFSISEEMTANQFHSMVNHESGLLGVSEISSDVRDLLSNESSDVRAAEAISLFCYQTRKWIGSFAAALGGLDTLVFAGGIGENSPVIRERICAGLSFLGFELDRLRNENNAALISAEPAPVSVRVIHTDEESMIAQSVAGILRLA